MGIFGKITAFLLPNFWWVILGASVTAFTAGGVIGWHEKELRVPALLTAQAKADKEVCDTDKKTTKEANDALQNDRDTIAANLAAYKLRKPARCVPVTHKTQPIEVGPEHAAKNGISVVAIPGAISAAATRTFTAEQGITSDWLREYAAEAETYRSERIVLEKFIDDERRPKGN